MFYILIIIFIYCWTVMPSLRDREVKGLYTHRGLYSKDGTIPENTLESFQASIDHGYGIELDVQLSKDGEVYVFHDDNLNRLFNEDLRYRDLLSSEIDLLCLNGSKIPRFSEVLDLVDGQVDLVVELKVGKGYQDLASKVVELLDSYNGKFVVESFDPRIVLWFRLFKSNYTRGQLIMEAKRYDTPKLAHLWINLFFNFLTRPDFVTVHKNLLPAKFNLWLYERLGGKLISWTIHEEDPDFPNIDAVIFEHYKPTHCRMKLSTLGNKKRYHSKKSIVLFSY